jgi:hypothetical protein
LGTAVLVTAALVVFAALVALVAFFETAIAPPANTSAVVVYSATNRCGPVDLFV